MHCLSAGPDGIAIIRGGPELPCLRGQVRFYQQRCRVLVVAEIQGLPQDSETGFFAMHIHGDGNCCGVGFPETGSHFNPAGLPHPEHAGDLPPLMLCGDGAYLAVRTDRFRVEEVIGKTVVIHSRADDFQSQPAGNTGSKIACGVIRRR